MQLSNTVPLLSRRNPRIQGLAALHQGRKRRATGLSLAEGVRVAREALLYAGTETLVLSEKLAGTPAGDELQGLARKRGVEILRISEACYDRISRLESPEGAAAVVKIRELALRELLAPDCRLVAAAGLQDPGNAGAIVRAAEAAGATGCVFLDGIDPGHPRLLRGAAGSAFRLPCAAGKTADFLEAARKVPVRILAAIMAGDALPYREADFTPPVAVCIGGEGGGLPEEIVRGADRLIAIPMAGKAQSLNAAVAAGIILYGTGWN
jgi:RNA methyltransferase, TrmH family